MSVGPNAKEIAHFAEMFDKFLDCLNCSSLSAGKRSRNPFKSPYRSGTDWKLKVATLICVCVCVCVCVCDFVCTAPMQHSCDNVNSVYICNYHLYMCSG